MSSFYGRGSQKRNKFISFHFISFITTQHHDTKLKIFAQDIKESGDDKCSLYNNLAI